MKNSNDIIGNRTSDLSAHKAVSSGSIITKRRTQRCYTALSYVEGRIYNGSISLKYIRTVLYENMLKLLLYRRVNEIFCIQTS